MTVDYSKLNQVVTQITAVVPEVVPLLEQVNTFPSTWYISVDPDNSFFFIPVHKGQQLHCPTSGYSHSPAICHNLVCRNLNCSFLP